MEIPSTPNARVLYVPDPDTDGSARDNYNAQVYPAGTQAEPGWLTAEQMEARFPSQGEAGPVAPEEMEARVRDERDSRLAATDYLMMPDYPISDGGRAAVRDYRQALRDLPGQPGFPGRVEWPLKGWR